MRTKFRRYKQNRMQIIYKSIKALEHFLKFLLIEEHMLLLDIPQFLHFQTFSLQCLDLLNKVPVNHSRS